MNRAERRWQQKHKSNKTPEPVTHYVCDPYRNVGCSKANCYLTGGPCKYTRHLAYAKQPVEKARMILPVTGKEREDMIKTYMKEDQ